VATTFRGITTPDLTDPALFTSQFKGMADDVDALIGSSLDQTSSHRRWFGADAALNGSWTYYETPTAWSPPTSWETYRLLVTTTVSVAGVGVGDNVESLIRRTAGGSAFDGPKTIDNGGLDRVVIATAEWSGLSGGPQRFQFVARNVSATAGKIYAAWTHVVATRQS